jgi:hypothetical protein
LYIKNKNILYSSVAYLISQCLRRKIESFFVVSIQYEDKEQRGVTGEIQRKLLSLLRFTVIGKEFCDEKSC